MHIQYFPYRLSTIKSGYKPNQLYAVLSLAAVLFLLGLLYLLYVYGNQTISYLKEQVRLTVELKNEAEDIELQAIKAEIYKLDNYKEESLTFISKADGMLIIEEELGEDLSSFGLDNPLFDVLTFNLQSEAITNENLKIISQQLADNSAVRDVYFQEKLVYSLEGNISKFKYIGLAIAILFLIIAISLIYNTVRLSIYNNRLTIKQMQLIGAKDSFIRKPYLKQALINGLVGGVLAVSLIQMVLQFLWSIEPEVREIAANKDFVSIYVGLVCLGILISLISTQQTVSRFLRTHRDELR